MNLINELHLIAKRNSAYVRIVGNTATIVDWPKRAPVVKRLTALVKTYNTLCK